MKFPLNIDKYTPNYTVHIAGDSNLHRHWRKPQV